MLIREGGDRTEAIDQWLASCLACIAGALNAAAFYAVGFFSANMTGNVSSLSDHIALGQWGPGAFYLGIILAFIAGSMSSTLLISAGRRRRIHRIYAYSIFAEAVLLGALGCADLWLLHRWRDPVLVLGLAFLMGLQNAVVTRISGARVRTTHVSGMATDIGIELATAIDILRGHETRDSAAQTWGKMRLHFYTILSFLAGGIAGIVIYRAIGGYLLIMSAFLLLIIALAGGIRLHKEGGGQACLRQAG